MMLMITFICLVLLSILDLSLGAFEEDVLAEHNKHRAKHGCPDLIIDDNLNADANAYATILADKDSLQHDKTGAAENLCMRSEDALKCVEDWYNENQYYDFTDPKYSPESAHFTQMIWRNNKRLGVGKARSASGKWYVVGRYKPGGNINGDFKNNVPEQRGGSKGSPGNKPTCSVLLTLCAFVLPIVLMQ